jgi:hypothetical protein
MSEQRGASGSYRPATGGGRATRGLLLDEPTARRQAMRLGLEFVDLEREPVPVELMAEIPDGLMHRYEFVPHRKTDKGLAIVTADPTDVLMIDEIEMLLGCRVQVCVGTAPAIRRVLAGEPPPATAEPSPGVKLLSEPEPHAARAGKAASENAMTLALTRAFREMVPVSLYHELQMKHEQLLVQYGAIRAYGSRLLELQDALEDKSREVETTRQDAARRQTLLAEENSQLRRKLRVAALELEGRRIEVAAFKEKVAALEMLTRNAVTSASIELQFSEVIRRARTVGRMESALGPKGSIERDVLPPPRPPSKPTPEH